MPYLVMFLYVSLALGNVGNHYVFIRTKFLLGKAEKFEYILFTQSNSVLKNLKELPKEVDQ